MDNTLFQEVQERLGQLAETIRKETPSLLRASFTRSGEGMLVLSANKEGLVYFASILASLADSASEGQHYHFDEHTVLGKADAELIIKYTAAP